MSGSKDMGIRFWLGFHIGIGEESVMYFLYWRVLTTTPAWTLLVEKPSALCHQAAVCSIRPFEAGPSVKAAVDKDPPPPPTLLSDGSVHHWSACLMQLVNSFNFLRAEETVLQVSELFQVKHSGHGTPSRTEALSGSVHKPFRLHRQGSEAKDLNLFLGFYFSQWSSWSWSYFPN